MLATLPWPGPGEDPQEPFEEGSSGISALDPGEAEPAARRHWDAAADEYQQEHGRFLAGFVWCPEGLREEDAGLLGPASALSGQRILEVGCGAAQCSTWLRDRGVLPVGLDLSLGQLRHARRVSPNVPVVLGTATALPFTAGTFDQAFSAFGAVQFAADLPRLLAQVHRVLVPGGRWTFSVTHPIRWAFPDQPGPEGLVASGWYFDRTPYVERDGTWHASYAEYHRTLGDYVRAVRAAGFSVEDAVEPEWPGWNEQVWGGWSPLRGAHLPGTLILSCRRAEGNRASR